MSIMGSGGNGKEKVWLSMQVLLISGFDSLGVSFCWIRTAISIKKIF
jgi:hypothetical protein